MIMLLRCNCMITYLKSLNGGRCEAKLVLVSSEINGFGLLQILRGTSLLIIGQKYIIINELSKTIYINK